MNPISLNAQWRVVYDPMQWILQRREGERWRDRSFCCTRAGLLRCIEESCGEADISGVLALPEIHPDRCVSAKQTAPAAPKGDAPLSSPQVAPAPPVALLPEGSYEVPYPLTYDADGNVELPACLDRRHLERVAADLADEAA